MRKAIGILAVLVVLGTASEARSAGWGLGWFTGLGHGGCGPAGCGHASGAMDEESPLYPQYTFWTFQKSNCKLGICDHLNYHKSTGETPYFPPLPYSHKAAAAAATTGSTQGSHSFP